MFWNHHSLTKYFERVGQIGHENSAMHCNLNRVSLELIHLIHCHGFCADTHGAVQSQASCGDFL